jgi:hypothetical protein
MTPVSYHADLHTFRSVNLSDPDYIQIISKYEKSRELVFQM